MRNGSLFLFSIFWLPALMVVGFGAVMAATHNTSDYPIAIFGVTLVAINKMLGVVLFASQQLLQSMKAINLYYKLFR